jgi:hypothetical protein
MTAASATLEVLYGTKKALQTDEYRTNFDQSKITFFMGTSSGNKDMME